MEGKFGTERWKIDKCWKIIIYLVPDGIKITLNEIERAVSRSGRKSSTACSASGLVDFFKQSTLQFSIALLQGAAAKCGVNLPYMKLRLTVVHSGYVVSGCIPTPRIVGLERIFIRTLVTYVRRLLRVYTTESLGIYDEKKQLCSSRSWWGGRPWVTGCKGTACS